MTYSILAGEAEHSYELVSIDPNGKITRVARLASCASVHAEQIVDALNLDHYALRLDAFTAAQVACDVDEAVRPLERLIEQAAQRREVFDDPLVRDAQEALEVLRRLFDRADECALPTCIECDERRATVVREHGVLENQPLCTRCADVIPGLGPHPIEVP